MRKTSTHRTDIQGLRAIAVLLVVADHLAGHPHGGFVGVDVFFVVSGFLISGLLLREHERSGRISLLAFYKRRVKRIAPAAVAVIAAVLLVSPFVLSPTRRSSTTGDAAWALLSAGNWRMIAVGTDYMHATDAVSPLQHYWSLAVEEQFYLVWPLLLIAALALRGTGRSRRLAGALITAIVIASLAFGAWESLSHPTAAYFSTFSRGWELGAGALLAIASPRLPRMDDAARALLGWGGLALIGYGALTLSGTSDFPVPGALLPVVGTLAVILSGEHAPAPYLRPLRSRAAQWLGERSYSLYLWHFPVIVFMGVLQPQLGKRYILLAAVLMALLTTLSYRFIEEPFRRRSWRAFLRSGPTTARPRMLSSAVAAVLVVATIGLAVVSHTPVTVKPVLVADLSAQVVASPAEVAREAAVRAALGATRWPHLSPSPGALSGDARVPEWLVDGCLGDEHHALPDPVLNARRCTYGSPSALHTAVLLGDSTAISWMPGLRKALGPNWRIEVWTDQQCPAVDVAVRRGDGSVSPHCPELRAAALARVRSKDPDLTILTSSSESLGHLIDNAYGSAGADEWRQATDRTIRAVAPFTQKLVVLDAPPDMHSAQDCIAPLTGPGDCVSQADGRYLTVARAQRAAVEAAHLSNVSYPDTLPWFCENGRCPSFAAGSPTLADGRHLTTTASTDLAPVLAGVLLHTPLQPRIP